MTDDELRADLEAQWDRDIQCRYDRLPDWYRDAATRNARRDAWVNARMKRLGKEGHHGTGH